jgi:sucrose-6-phosphate hydrolase SacC (GH32 family)
MPFNQQMTVPCELTLRSTEDGVRLFATPVRELAALRGGAAELADLELGPDRNPLAGITGDLFDIDAVFEIGRAKRIGLDLRGVPLVYDATRHELACRGKVAPLAPVGGRIRLRVLLDRGSVEVFGNEGRVAMSIGVIPEDANRGLGLFAEEGPARIVALSIFPMRSAWREAR